MTTRLTGRDIAIVGGGIAGLTAALAFAQRGARVTVHERAPAITEVGAGLQISPNAMRVLRALGLEARFQDVSLRSHGVQLNDQRGRPVARLNMSRHRPHDEFRLVHRARLIELLHDAALQADVQIRLGHEVSKAPAASLVVGADGLHSQIRKALNGREVPFFTHQTAWRAVIADDAAPIGEAQIFMGPRCHIVSYPLANGFRNIVAVQERHEWQQEGWTQRGDPARLRSEFAGFGGPVPDWLGRVRDCGIWGLFRHQVARNWQDGRHVIIGDAAHPTLPFMAQGAVMAIEDAWQLVAALDSEGDQAAALSRFETTRRPRVQRIVDAANANARNYHMTGVRKIAGHTALRMIDRISPAILLRRFDWLYDYDPVADRI
ncbi:FAD-dependent oxidoreductase [Paracoccus sp. Z330]|uniref:FAD-dependent oxidoreductase n=1 Tax=Paracoccus onchidii TaxID=3017813 RepID=A0ABT4ZCN6_9RHOB|nr:FAD-dependent oxidoreductase [Paracoccus onchidii]MDB6177035.1 FAD-dependent oxidoreductase [Paracoccus onchidii]